MAEDPIPVSVLTDAAHAQGTDESPAKPVGSENTLPAPVKPRAKRMPPPRRRRTEKPTLQPPRLAFFIDEKEHIDLDRVADETIERLKVAISTPEARQRLGLVDATGEPIAERSWKGMTTTLVDSLNAIAAQAAVNAWKLTDDQAALLILQREPKTHDQVVTLTGELLDKYFPGGFGAYDKEISLLILLGGFVGQSVQQIRASMPATSTPTLAYSKPDDVPAVN
jgi:hypothetical protein